MQTLKRTTLALLLVLSFALAPCGLKLAEQAASAQKTIKTEDNQVDFGPYIADVQKKVKRNWFPPRSNSTNRVVAQWKIHKDGTVSDVRIISHASNDGKSDAAALKAIGDSAPFARLPDGAPENIDIQFTFDYNVFNNKKKMARDLTQRSSAAPEASASNRTDSQPGDATSTNTVRVTNLANLEALLNILANSCEIQLMLMAVAVAMAGTFLLIFARGRRLLGGIMLGLAPIMLVWGLAIPGIINWLVASARDANLFS